MLKKYAKTYTGIVVVFHKQCNNLPMKKIIFVLLSLLLAGSCELFVGGSTSGFLDNLYDELAFTNAP